MKVISTSTIINGQQQGSCICLENHETALIRGFSITNGYGDYVYYMEDYIGGGIKIYSISINTPVNADVIKCKIFSNYAGRAGGIIIHKSNAFLSQVDIINNYANIGGGLYIDYDSEVEFDTENRCNIYNNYAGTAVDIFAYAAGDIYVNVDTFTVVEPTRYFAHSSQLLPSSPCHLYFDIQHGWLEQVNHDLYVATWGDDNNTGFTPDEPLKTIAWAMHKIKNDTLDPKTVYVEDGVYSHADNGQIFPIALKSNVALIGESRESTVLENDFLEKSSWCLPFCRKIYKSRKLYHS